MNHHASDELRMTTAREDHGTAEVEALKDATWAQLVMLVEQFRGHLDAVLRICGCFGPTPARANLVEAEEADLGQATREYLEDLAGRLHQSLGKVLRVCAERQGR